MNGVTVSGHEVISLQKADPLLVSKVREAKKVSAN